MKRILLIILGILTGIGCAGTSDAHDIIHSPQWVPLTPIEQRALEADEGKLHDLPLWFTPYNTQRPKVPYRVDVLGDRNVYMADDPVGQFILHMIALPWNRNGARVQLEIVTTVEGRSRRVTVADYDNIQTPKLAVRVALDHLEPGQYKLIAKLLGAGKAFIPIGEWAFEKSAQSRNVMPFPKEGVPLKVHAQNHIKDAIWPITTAVPLPRHAADSTGRFVLLENGKPVPAQFTTRARWYPTDGEIKWMGVDFQARYDNGKPRPYVVKQLPRGKAAPALDTPLKVTEHADRFEINTGKIAFTVNRKSFAGIEQAQWVNKDGSLGELLLNGKGGPFLTDERLYDYNSAMDEEVIVRIEEQGPVRVTILAQGWYTNNRNEKACIFQTRISAYAGQPKIDVYHTTIITYDTDRKQLRQLGFALKPVSATHWQFGADGKAHKGELPTKTDKKKPTPSVWLHQDRHDHFRLIQGDDTAIAEGKQSDGWMQTTTANGVITVAVRNLWQLYPKELEVSRDSLNLHFWPKHGHVAYSRDEELDNQHIHKIRYAHQGELLDLDMPQAYFERLPKTAVDLCGPLRGGRILEQQDINALGGNGQGLAISNDFTIEFARDEAKTQPQQKAALFQQNPHAITDPIYNGLTEVEGRFAGYNPKQFPGIERLFDVGHRGYTCSVDVLENYGMWIWPDLHNNWSLNQMAPQTHRWWLNSHYQGVWEGPFLYFRAGLPYHYNWARNNSEHFANVSTVNYDNPIEPLQGKFAGANYHTKGFLPWGSARFSERTGDDYVELSAHFINPDAHMLYYLLFGCHRRLELANKWFNSLGRASLAPERSREACTTLGELVSYYENTWDPQAIVYIRNIADEMNSRPWTEIPHHPGHTFFHDRWVQRYWELTRDPKLKARLLDWFTPEQQKVAASYPQVGALAWRMTGNDTYLKNAFGMAARVGRGIYENPEDPLNGMGGKGYYFPARSVGESLPYYMQAVIDAGLTIPAEMDTAVVTYKVYEPKKDAKPYNWLIVPPKMRYVREMVGYLHINGDKPVIELTFSGYTNQRYCAAQSSTGRLRITDADGNELFNTSVLNNSMRPSASVRLDASKHKQPFKLHRWGAGLFSWTGDAQGVIVSPGKELAKAQ